MIFHIVVNFFHVSEDYWSIQSFLFFCCVQGPTNRLQTAIFGDSAGICKTRIQQHKAAAAEFGTFLLKTAMSRMAIRNRPPENSHAGPESSFSLTRQAQTNRNDRRIRSIII
jgi:hypothetical protein